LGPRRGNEPKMDIDAVMKNILKYTSLIDESIENFSSNGFSMSKKILCSSLKINHTKLFVCLVLSDSVETFEDYSNIYFMNEFVEGDGRFEEDDCIFEQCDFFPSKFETIHNLFDNYKDDEDNPYVMWDNKRHRISVSMLKHMMGQLTSADSITGNYGGCMATMTEYVSNIQRTDMRDELSEYLKECW
jgi:hypothetical protein